MKKFSIIILTALAFVFAGCEVENQPVEHKQVRKSFNVVMDGTKTTLDGLTVKWAAGDIINVIGVTAGGTVTEHPFTLQSGAGSATAVFEGNVNDDETTFYAVYPNVAIDKTKFTNNNRLNLSSNLAATRLAVKDGFDPAAAIMAAKESTPGTLSFVHLMAYFKITVGVDDVASIRVQTSNGRFNGKPNITVPDFNTVSVDGSTTNDVSIAPSAGTFEKDASYYIPVTVKSSSVKTFTVEYTFSDSAVASISTDKLTSYTLAAGKVYDLGTPPIVKPAGPSLSLLKTSVSDIEPDAASGLTIDAAYTIANGTDSDIDVTCDGTIVTAASVSGGTVTYTISENTGTARKGWIGLQAGTGSVLKIDVNQKGSAAIVLTNVTTTTTWGASLWGQIYDAEGADAVKKDMIVDNLGFVDGGGSGFKFDKSKGQVQLAGTGVAGTKCCIQFKVGGEGTVTITCRSANKTSTRNLKVALGNIDKGQISAPGYEGNDPVTEAIPIYGATAGDIVNIYSANSGINIFSITWTPAS